MDFDQWNQRQAPPPHGLWLVLLRYSGLCVLIPIILAGLSRAACWYPRRVQTRPVQPCCSALMDSSFAMTRSALATSVNAKG